MSVACVRTSIAFRRLVNYHCHSTRFLPFAHVRARAPLAAAPMQSEGSTLGLIALILWVDRFLVLRLCVGQTSQLLHTGRARAFRQSRVPLPDRRSLLYCLLTESHLQPVWGFSFPFSTTGRPIDVLLEIYQILGA